MENLAGAMADKFLEPADLQEIVEGGGDKYDEIGTDAGG